MKKTYKQPTMKAIDIDMTEMIAQSGGSTAPNSLGFGGSNADGGGPTAAESKASNNLWDDEEW